MRTNHRAEAAGVQLRILSFLSIRAIFHQPSRSRIFFYPLQVHLDGMGLLSGKWCVATPGGSFQESLPHFNITRFDVHTSASCLHQMPSLSAHHLPPYMTPSPYQIVLPDPPRVVTHHLSRFNTRICAFPPIRSQSEHATVSMQRPERPSPAPPKIKTPPCPGPPSIMRRSCGLQVRYHGVRSRHRRSQRGRLQSRGRLTGPGCTQQAAVRGGEPRQ